MSGRPLHIFSLLLLAACGTTPAEGDVCFHDCDEPDVGLDSGLDSGPGDPFGDVSQPGPGPDADPTPVDGGTPPDGGVQPGPPQPQPPHQRLTSSRSRNNANLGWSVVSDGVTVVAVAGTSAGPNGGEGNAAHVFEERDGVWAEEIILDATTVGAAAYRHESDVWADRIALITTSFDGSDAPREVHVYRRGATTWELETTLSHELMRDQNPSSVAVGEEFVAVGFHEEDLGRNVILVFALLVDGAWGLDQIIGATGDPNQYLGYHLDSDGHRLFAQASGVEVDGERRAGAIRVYERGPAGWQMTGEMARPGEFSEAAMDGEIAVDGDRVVAAVRDRRGDPNGSRGAYVFHETEPGNWVLESFLAMNEDVELRPAPSAAIRGERIVLGEVRGEVGGTSAGEVLVYERDSVWSHTDTVRAWDPEARAQFGFGVALTDRHIVAGAPGAWTGEIFGGALYFFEM